MREQAEPARREPARPVQGDVVGRSERLAAGGPAAAVDSGRYLLHLQRSAGNRAVTGLLSSRRPPPVSRGARRVQRVYENVFKADPDAWLKANVLTLDMPRGLETRTPSLKFDTKKFIADLAGREKHWFVLVPDPTRTRTGSPGKPARKAYLLTPAVEKYVAEYAEGDELLTAIRSDEKFAAVEASPAYIEAAYVQYLRGKTTVPDTAVGHTSVKKERGGEGFNPDFVFTDVMNGCAWAITDDEEDESRFTAWHYQSPSSNKPEASAFRRDKAPTDWFGVEEYGAGEHKGLFETTNLLFRNDQGWNVASQVNDVSHLDMNDVTASTTQSRALDLEGTTRPAVTKKIFLGLAEEQEYEFGRQYKNAFPAKFDTAEAKKIHSYFTKMLFAVKSEIQEIGGATTMGALHDAAEAGLERRTGATGEVNSLRDEILVFAERKLEEYKKKWFPDRGETVSLEGIGNNVTQAAALFAKTGWLTQLAQETAPGEG